MVSPGYFYLQKIEGLREFIICTAYIALRKRTHTLWSKSISMELNFQRRREDQSFDGGNCISNQSFSNHLLHAIPLCNQKKFISNASSEGSIINGIFAQIIISTKPSLRNWVLELFWGDETEMRCPLHKWTAFQDFSWPMRMLPIFRKWFFSFWFIQNSRLKQNSIAFGAGQRGNSISI